MNRAAIAVAIVVASMQIVCASCPNGSVDWKGNCAADLKPEGGPDGAVPSKETAPEDKMPSYQRGGVHVVDVPAMTTVDDEIATAKKHEAKPAPIQVSSDVGKEPK